VNSTPSLAAGKTEIRVYPDVSCGGRERTCSRRADFAESMYRMAACHRRRGLREARPLYGFSILYLLLLFAGLAVRIVLCLVPGRPVLDRASADLLPALCAAAAASDRISAESWIKENLADQHPSAALHFRVGEWSPHGLVPRIEARASRRRPSSDVL
jgi:hypothetical protein